MRRIPIILTLAVVLGAGASAQVSSPPVPVPNAAPAAGRTCPDLSKIRGICTAVSENRPRHSDYQFAWAQMIHQAACADQAPVSSEANYARIRQLWREHNDLFQCNFGTAPGSLLKYSISVRSFSVIPIAIGWGLDLNIIDPDRMTVLDYVAREANRFRCTDLGEELLGVGDMLRTAGAKYSWEIPGSGATPGRELAEFHCPSG